jgi:hypothetical protein
MVKFQQIKCSAREKSRRFFALHQELAEAFPHTGPPHKWGGSWFAPDGSQISPSPQAWEGGQEEAHAETFALYGKMPVPKNPQTR